MEIEPTDSGACSIDRFWLDIQFDALTFYPTTMMHSPAPNIPGAASPFNEYMDELEAASIDDIRELNETTDALFACKDASIYALGIGSGAALAVLILVFCTSDCG
jgi:hypothetical protein